MNAYWQSIDDFWREREELIHDTPRNEWAIGLYEWEGVVRLTPIELWLWGDMRELNAVFYPQWPVAGFFVDFANPVAKVAIECDGAAYHLDQAKDAERDRRLRELGWEVYRFSGRACRRERDEETLEATPAFDQLTRICQWHGLTRSRETVKAMAAALNGKAPA